MTRIGFIRHGTTDWNIAGRIQGQIDVPLNKIGREQAKRLADRLAKEKWDIIYSSDLSRAVETAEIIAEKLNINVILDERLPGKEFW